MSWTWWLSGKRIFERVQGSRAAEMAASLLLKELGRMIYENQRRLPVQDIGKWSHCEGVPGVKEKVATGLGKTKAMSKKDGEKREGNMSASECREDQQRRVYATRWSYVTYPSYLNCPMATAPVSHRSNLSLLDAMPGACCAVRSTLPKSLHSLKFRRSCSWRTWRSLCALQISSPAPLFLCRWWVVSLMMMWPADFSTRLLRLVL